jgi:hypothetical protein
MTKQPTLHYTESAASRLDGAVIRALVPQLVADWIDLMGLAPTLALVRAYPGLQIKVPIGTRPGLMTERLSVILGAEHAAAFIARHGGEHLAVPSCKALARVLRDVEICKAYDEGHKPTEIAMAFALTIRQVRHILNRPDDAVMAHRRARLQDRLATYGDGNPSQLDLLSRIMGEFVQGATS